MSENLKFRLWNGFKILKWEEIIKIFKITVFIEEKEDPYKLMQYTEIRDKNGSEIYNGDIVKLYTLELDKEITREEDSQDDFWEIRKHNGAYVMWFSENDFYYIDRNIDSMTRDMPDDWNIEVVGNIYENKELIDDAKT